MDHPCYHQKASFKQVHRLLSQPIAPKNPIVVHTDDFSSVIVALQAAQSVLLTVHVGPDGDALGSMLAIKLALDAHALNIPKVDCWVDGPVAALFSILPGIQSVRSITSAKDITTPYDVAICVDCGSADRLGAVAPHFANATTSINLDHHISNENFADINIVLMDAAASGEVVARLLDALQYPLDPEIAACLFITLVTDTGGFKFSNTTSYTHQLAARCMETGIDHEKIYKQVYEQIPIAQGRLRARCLLQAEFSHDGRLAWTVVSKALREELGAKEEHTDGVVDMLRQIDSTELCVVFKESDDGEIKASLRSDNHNYDVSAIVQPFGGGGHKMAAGCTLAGMTLPEAKSALLNSLSTLLK